MGNFALPLLLFAALYVFFIVPQGRRRKQALALQRAVEPGSRVILTSGLYGTVVEIDDDAVVIEAAEGVQLRYAKAAVLRVVPDVDDSDDADEVHDSELDEFEEDLADDDGLDDVKALDGVEEQTEPDDEVPPPPSSDPFSKRFLKRPPRRQSHGSSDGTDGNDAGSGPVPTS
ncbi:MAG: preprotein translocase subunit YajC [Actinomycetota bacterium]|nr:preprotein translocase subunit YajC [Actinomycetota bacterium]MDQ1494492.1 preprotein translocase subunit YajC [Actinomycetota bacterium]